MSSNKHSSVQRKLLIPTLTITFYMTLNIGLRALYVCIKWKTGASAVSADCIDTHRRRGMPTTTLCWAISVPLPPCLTGLYSLHCHAKNTPLIGLAPDHMHSDPVPLLVPVSATREPGQRMPIHAPKSRFLCCSYTPLTEINSNRELGSAMSPCTSFHRHLLLFPLFLEFVYATCWYRKLWVIATTAQLKEDWIRVLF